MQGGRRAPCHAQPGRNLTPPALPPTLNTPPLPRHTPHARQVGVFRVLLELVGVAPDAVGGHARELVPGIQAALQDGSTAGASSKIQALQFLSSGGRRVLGRGGGRAGVGGDARPSGGLARGASRPQGALRWQPRDATLPAACPPPHSRAQPWPPTLRPRSSPRRPRWPSPCLRRWGSDTTRWVGGGWAGGGWVGGWAGG